MQLRRESRATGVRPEVNLDLKSLPKLEPLV